MRIRLPYDQEELKLKLNSYSRLETVAANYPSSVEDTSGELRSALQNPEGTGPLKDLLPEKGRISVLISDLTRGGGTGGVLGGLLSVLSEWGIERERIEVFIATGMHRNHTPGELASHLGKHVAENYKIFQHDPTDGSKLLRTGTNGRGKPYLFNSRVVDSSLIVVLGTVSFHYFAGHGGGRKLILPGVAGEESILSNHRLSLHDNPGAGLADGCEPANLEGNPVHLDMLEGARSIPVPVFTVNIISGQNGEVVYLNAGELEESHLSACDFLRENFTIPLRRRYRAVIASAGGYPADVNLLQAHKSVRHASAALKDGGVLLVAAACRDGVGSDSYYQAFSEGRERVAVRAREDYTLNSQTAVSTLELTGRYSIHLATRLEERRLSRLGFSGWEPAETMDILRGIPADEILVIVNASRFLPVYRKDD